MRRVIGKGAGFARRGRHGARVHRPQVVVQHQRGRADGRGQQPVARRPHHRRGHAGAGRVGLQRVAGLAHDAGVALAGRPADHQGPGVEGGPEVLQHDAEEHAALRRVGQAVQRPGAEEGFGAALASAGAGRSVELQDAVADFTGHALQPGEQAVVEHDAGADADATGHEDQRIHHIALGELVLAERGGVGFVLHVHRHRWRARLGQRARDQRQKTHVAPAQVGRETHRARGFVERAGQADADARHHHRARRERGVREHHQPRHLLAHRAGLVINQRFLDRPQHLAGERHTHHPQRLHRDFDADHRAAAAVDAQGRRGPAQALGGGETGFDDPAFVDQLAHELAHGRFGQPAFLRELRAREAAVVPQQAQQHAAVDAFDQLLVAGGFHAVVVESTGPPRPWSCAFPSGCLPAMIMPRTSSSVTSVVR